MLQKQLRRARFALERPVSERRYLSFKGRNGDRFAAPFNPPPFFNHAGDIRRFFLTLTLGLLRAVPQVARLELMLYGGLLIADVVIARGMQLLVLGVSHGKPSDPEAGAATCIRLVTGRSPAFSHSATLLRSAFCSPKRNEHRTHLWRRRCSPFLSFTSGGRRIGLTAAQRAVAIRVSKPGGRE